MSRLKQAVDAILTLDGSAEQVERALCYVTCALADARSEERRLAAEALIRRADERETRSDAADLILRGMAETIRAGAHTGDRP